MLLLSAGGLVTALALAALGTRGEWATGARRVRWLGPNGRALASDATSSACDGVDIGIGMLVHDGALWTSCDAHPAFPAGAYARIDPAKAVGTIAWPLPASAPDSSTVGLMPHRDGRLGIVYAAGDVNGRLAAGIAGPRGWIRAPELLPGGPGTRLLGVAWVGDALEIAVRPAVDGSSGEIRDRLVASVRAPPAVMRLTASERNVRRPFADPAAMCPASAEMCEGAGLAFHSREVRGWVFPLDTWIPQRGSTIWEIAESGEPRRSSWAVSAVMVEEYIDRVAHGVLRLPAFADVEGKESFALASDGSLRRREPPPPGWETTGAWRHFRTVDGILQRHTHWVKPGNRFVMARRIGKQFIVMSSTEGEPHNRLVVRDETNSKNVRRRIVARAPSYSCGGLVTGAFVPAKNGGYWLVDRSGCFVALDASFRRTDPLGVIEHLRRRGSQGMNWNEPWHAWMLGWVLFGLPLCVIGEIAVVRAVHRARGKTLRTTAQGLARAAAFFVVTAGYALWRVLPLLR